MASLERTFPAEDLFFSTTDDKGVITACNPVFQRVSGYAMEELVGRAHNVVRHPEMPRAVFRLLWDALAAGRPVAAYVQNLTSDGEHYWVMATAAPVPGGFLSVRLKPTGEHFAAAREIYARVRERELAVEGGDVRRRKPSIQAGIELMTELLHEAGFNDYGEFMHAALPAEVTAREGLLGGSARARLGTPPPGADPTLTAILERCCAAHDFLDGVVANIERYAALSATLDGKSRFVVELSASIRLFSLNAMITSARMGDEGVGIGAVAWVMRSRSDTTEPVIAALHDDLVAAVDLLADMGFRIAIAQLQAEMLMRFVRELMAGEADDAAAAALVPLAERLGDGTDRLLESLAGLDRRLRGVIGSAAILMRGLDALRVLEFNGRVEAARVADSATYDELLAAIGQQVRTARSEIAGFADAAAMTCERDGAAELLAHGKVAAVREHVAAYR